MTDFDFHHEYDGSLSIKSAVFQALGAASTCWESLGKAGVFDDVRAKEIGDALLARIKEDLDQPRLGLATTDALLNEIRTRIEIDYHSGGGGLDYTTVAGRPDRTLA